MPPVYLGMWEWFTGAPAGSHWRAPSGDALGALDLRPLPAMSLTGGAPQGFGLFVYPTARANPLLVVYLGDDVNANLTPLQKGALGAGLGVALSNTRLVDVLWELFNVRADAAGATRWKPLLPQTDGKLVLHLGGFSPVREDAYSHARYPLVQQVVKADWEELERGCADATNAFDVEGLTWERAQAQFAGLRALKSTDPNVELSLEWGRLQRLAALPEPEHHKRVLQALCEKYKMNVNELEAIWQRALPSPLPHGTTINENWNCADSASLNCQLTWTEIIGNTNIVTNKAQFIDTATGNIARADSNLASADHYAQVDIITRTTGTVVGLGPITRKDSTATETFYWGRLRQGNDNVQLLKDINGTFTLLGLTTAVTVTLPNPIRQISNGSTISLNYNGVEKVSVTDTSITGNLRTGIEGSQDTTGSEVDNFQAADLAAFNLERRERHYPRGHMRGALRGVL